MSVEATTAVWKGSTADGNTLLVLLALADYADEHGYCWPSWERLERKTRLSRATIHRQLAKLYESGELAQVRRGGRIDGRAMTNLYQIQLGTLWARVSDRDVETGRGVSIETDMGLTAMRHQPPVENYQESLLPSVEEKKKSTERAEIASAIETLHATWVEHARPARVQLTPSQERLLRKALSEAPLPLCQQAIIGLVAWQQRKGGDLNLSRVFQTRPGGNPLGEQIEFFASQAPGVVTGSGFVPSEVADEIRDAKLVVVRTAAFGRTAASKEMEEALALLQKHGITASFTEEIRDGIDTGSKRVSFSR